MVARAATRVISPTRRTILFASSNDKTSDTILCDLQTFLRLIDVVPTGGAAKQLIQGGECMLNDQIETRRAKKLHPGDIVSFNGSDYDVSDHVALHGYEFKPKVKKVKPKPKTMEDGSLEFGGRYRSEEWRKERKERKQTKAKRKSEKTGNRDGDSKDKQSRKR